MKLVAIIITFYIRQNRSGSGQFRVWNLKAHTPLRWDPTRLKKNEFLTVLCDPRKSHFHSEIYWIFRGRGCQKIRKSYKKFNDEQSTCRILLNDITDHMGPINIDSKNALLFFIEKIYSSSNHSGSTNLYSVKLNGQSKERIMTLTPCRSYDGPISDRNRGFYFR